MLTELVVRSLLEGGVIHLSSKYPFRHPDTPVKMVDTDKVSMECAIVGCRPEHQMYKSKVSRPVKTLFGGEQSVGRLICPSIRHLIICKFHREVNENTGPLWEFHKLAFAIQQLLDNMKNHPGLCYTIMLAGPECRRLILWWRKHCPPSRDPTDSVLQYLYTHFVGENRQVTDCLDLIVWIKCAMEQGQIPIIPPILFFPQVGDRQNVLGTLTIKQRQLLAKAHGYVSERDGWNWRGPYPGAEIDLDPDIKKAPLIDLEIDLTKPKNFHTIRPVEVADPDDAENS